MEKEYRKTISSSEGRHRYWHITKEDRDFFPDAHEIFKLKFHDRVFSLQVNHKDDIMTGQLYEKYRFLEGEQLLRRRICFMSLKLRIQSCIQFYN